MDQRLLGGNGLMTSAIGLWCMGLSHGYGQADDEESIGVVHPAFRSGITMLETAMSYGLRHNEQLISLALAGRTQP